MDRISIDNVQYDPYYILQVTKDDSDDHIAKAYRKKAKKYHPDKTPIEKREDYALKFKIVTEAYNYIRKRRINTIKTNPADKTPADQMDLTNELTDPNKFGYGEHQRIQTIEEYEDFKVQLINQFQDKKFDHTEFNKLFEYNKTLQKENDKDVKAIVHRTTDGFFGYNTADTGSCAMVHSFNGLMITGDDFGEAGVGYWGDGYSDYKKTFTGVQNPDTIVQVPIDYEPPEKINENKSFEEYKKSYENTQITAVRKHTTFKKEEEIMCKKVMNTLIEREKEDEAFVEKYAKQYKPEIVRAAINKDLDRSPTLLDNLQEHFNVKKLGSI